MVNLGAFILSGDASRGEGGTGTPSPTADDRAPSPVRSSSVLPAINASDGSPRSHSRAARQLPRYAEREGDQGPYNARSLARAVPRHVVLDFSFRDLDDVTVLPKTEPRAGTVVPSPGEKGNKTTMTAAGTQQQRQQQQERKEGATADGTAWDFGDKRPGGVERTGDGFLVVRAGEETYAFKDEEELERKRQEMMNDPDQARFSLDRNGKLVMTRAKPAAQAPKRYRCTALKLDNNHLTTAGMARLRHVLTSLIANPLANITTLDLSFNRLTAIPSFDGLPLQTLLLHCNAIPTLAEVSKLQALHGSLKKLTLMNNPLQERTPKYKFAVLHQLPFLTCFDDVRVTAKDRERIAIFEELFVPSKDRGTTKKFLPPLPTATV